MFLPENYREPVTDNYMRFADGKNVFRVLSEAIVGMEYWKTETNENGEEVRKPVRIKVDERIPTEELGFDKWGNPEFPKHFWAFVVYNRAAEKIQILEITQKKIQRAIKSLVDDEDWGDPKDYDICVTRSGEKLETEYIVQGKPKAKLDESILEEYKVLNINLKALFSGADPFAKKNDDEIDIEEIAKEL